MTNRDVAVEPATVDRIARLLSATAVGDRRAFAALYQATSRKLYGVALKVIWRRDLADDVLQETYLRIWKNAQSYEPKHGSPITWMVAIARNAAIDAIRRRQRADAESTETDLTSIAAELPDPLDEIAMARERHRAFAAFKKLDAEKRDIILAAYLRGQSREQLAAQLGVPVNTVKSRLHRALLDFRNGLEAPDRNSRAA